MAATRGRGSRAVAVHHARQHPAGGAARRVARAAASQGPRRDGASDGCGRAAVWRRPAYNWITGACFSAVSMLFMLGSLLLLVPDAIAPSELVTNGLFFLGSIPFTSPASCRTSRPRTHRRSASQKARRRADCPDRLEAEQPRLAQHLCAAHRHGRVQCQHVRRDRRPRRLAHAGSRVWTPGMIGSVMFLASGYLAFIEVGHNTGAGGQGTSPGRSASSICSAASSS